MNGIKNLIKEVHTAFSLFFFHLPFCLLLCENTASLFSTRYNNKVLPWKQRTALTKQPNLLAPWTWPFLSLWYVVIAAQMGKTPSRIPSYSPVSYPLSTFSFMHEWWLNLLMFVQSRIFLLLISPWLG
jgi:hypothetical protein